MSNPMTTPHLHDRLVLLDGGKRWEVPGASQVKVTLQSNVDELEAPADGKQVVQLMEASADVEVDVTMWTAQQWDQYQHLLAHLRRGTKAGPAVFTSAHPELTARRVKRLYFISEANQPYSPKTGYRVTLKFKEKLKDKTRTQAVQDGGEVTVPPNPRGGGPAAGNAKEAAVAQAALATTIAPPAPADGGRANTAQPGYCSASVRVAATAAGVDPKLFGGTANATQANFARAGLTEPWNENSRRNLKPGQLVFFKEPAGSGHVGVVTGFSPSGEPLVTGNNYVTYAQRGGTFDAGGRPVNQNIDARGTVPIGRLGQPVSVGYPGGRPSGPRAEGPAAPLPPSRPSLKIAPPLQSR